MPPLPVPEQNLFQVNATPDVLIPFFVSRGLTPTRLKRRTFLGNGCEVLVSESKRQIFFFANATLNVVSVRLGFERGFVSVKDFESHFVFVKSVKVLPPALQTWDSEDFEIPALLPFV